MEMAEFAPSHFSQPAIASHDALDKGCYKINTRTYRENGIFKKIKNFRKG